MSAEWSLSDDQLALLLQLWVTHVAGDGPFVCRLFKNDYHPVPGAVEGDYDECDFNGYAAQDVDANSFGAPTVTDNIATTLSSDEVIFAADSAGFVSQTVYGYYLINAAADYVWGYRFAEPRLVMPYDKISLKVELKQANLVP